MEVGAQVEAGLGIQARDCAGPSGHGCGENGGRRAGFERRVGSRTLGTYDTLYGGEKDG